jgi:hypothetical protein
MQVTRVYQWDGTVSSYQRGNSSIPCDPSNGDYREIEQAIVEGRCTVNDPIIERVVSAYNQRGRLSGYKWNGVFVPIDTSNALYRLIKQSIDNGSCLVEEPSSNVNANEPKTTSLVFAIILDSSWKHVKESYENTISYRHEAAPEHHEYNFRLVNLGEKEGLNVIDLLLQRYAMKPFLPKVGPSVCTGVLEVEIPTTRLAKIFRNERYRLDEGMKGFIESLLKQRLLELGRSSSQVPDIEWLINHALWYAGRLVMGLANMVIDAHAKEYGDLPNGYVDYWKIRTATLVIKKQSDGTNVLGLSGFQTQYSFGLSGRGSTEISLLQVSRPEDHPVHPYDYAMARARMLVKSGLHLEALCLVDSLLEINVRSILLAWTSGHNSLQTFVNDKLNHKNSLRILRKLARECDDDLIKSDESYHRLFDDALQIHSLRNSYIHELQLPNSERAWPMSMAHRQTVETLIHHFIDIQASKIWFGWQPRLVQHSAAAAYQMIEKEMKGRDADSVRVSVILQRVADAKQSIFTVQDIQEILDQCLSEDA